MVDWKFRVRGFFLLPADQADKFIARILNAYRETLPDFPEIRIVAKLIDLGPTGIFRKAYPRGPRGSSAIT